MFCDAIASAMSRIFFVVSGVASASFVYGFLQYQVHSKTLAAALTANLKLWFL